MDNKAKVLNKIFRDLRKRSLWAYRYRSGFASNDGHYAFYTSRDFTSLKQSGEMRIYFGCADDADAVCEVATNHGVTAFWSGNVYHRVLLDFNNAPGTIEYVSVESFAVPLTSLL